jgi:hypothetical protein
VLSHPPHGEVDLQRAAAVLRLVPAEVRHKATYQVPEIWLAEASDEAAEAGAAKLRQAGLRVVTVPGAAVAASPPQELVASFAFENDGLRLVAETPTLLAYDELVIAVTFAPRPAEGKAALPQPAVELCAPTTDGYQRWTILQGVTGFAGQAPRQSGSMGANLRAFVADLERRFPHVRVDRRLLNMQVRRRGGTAPTSGPVRQGYSYATAALNQLLESIEPGLSDLAHEELAVRLAFLTHVAG